MDNIQTVKQRESLKPRREPYWDRLANGQHIGYRRTETGGTWVAKYRDTATGERSIKALGDLESVQDKDRYDEAVTAARRWFEHLGSGGATGKTTVGMVCALYIEELKDEGKYATAVDVHRRFEQYVYAHKSLMQTDIQKLSEQQIKAWRRHLRDLPTATGGKRSDSSLNRDIVPFRAALRLAHRRNLVTTDTAWKNALTPVKAADKRRTHYPTRDEMKRIISVSEPALAAFLTALASVPVRPGALAALKVQDFNATTSTLIIPTDKAGENRSIKLPATTAAHFRKNCEGKLPAAHIFTKDGHAWTKDRWKLPFKVAAIAADVYVVSKTPSEISPDKRMSKAKEAQLSSDKDTLITIYSFRHATITQLIEDGLPIQSVAQIAGTSPRMIHQNYGHLTERASEDALERIAL
jgi:integrase